MGLTGAWLERKFAIGEYELVCRFYWPVFDGQDFSCRYEIGWPDGMRSREIWNVDAISALLLALSCAYRDLLLRRDRDAIDIRWLGGRQLGLSPENMDWMTPSRD